MDLAGRAVHVVRDRQEIAGRRRAGHQSGDRVAHVHAPVGPSFVAGHQRAVLHEIGRSVPEFRACQQAAHHVPRVPAHHLTGLAAVVHVLQRGPHHGLGLGQVRILAARRAHHRSSDRRPLGDGAGRRRPAAGPLGRGRAGRGRAGRGRQNILQTWINREVIATIPVPDLHLRSPHIFYIEFKQRMKEI